MPNTPIRILAPSGISRRALLRASALGAAALGVGRPARADQAPLNLFTWQVFGDKPFADFSAEHAMPIQPTFYSSSDEMIAKLKGGGTRIYDMCVPVQNYAEIGAKVGVLEPLDLALLTNLPGVFEPFKSIPGWQTEGKTYGVPFVWGANAMAFNRKETGDVDSLDALFDPKFKGRITMRNEAFDSLAIGALKLGIKDPWTMDDQALGEVKKLMISQKPLVRAYWTSIAELKNLFGSGEAVVGWAFLAIVKPLRDQGMDIGWVWPKEGAIGFSEGIAMVKGTRNAAAVQQYANLTLSPEYGLMMAKESRYATTSAEAVRRMDPAMVKDLGIDPSLLPRLVFKANPPDSAKWVEIWNEVKAA